MATGLMNYTQYGITIFDLEDNGLNAAREIKLLIGSNVEGKFLTDRRKILSNGLVALETFLGWCIMGKIPDDMNPENVAMTVTSLLLENMKIENLSNLNVLDPAEKITANELEEATNLIFFNTVKTQH